MHYTLEKELRAKYSSSMFNTILSLQDTNLTQSQLDTIIKRMNITKYTPSESKELKEDWLPSAKDIVYFNEYKT